MLPVLTSGLTKTQIKLIAQSSVNELMSNGRILEAAEALTVMENFIKEVRSSKEFTEYVREEVGKNGKDITNPSGAKIELAETGTKYDYSGCNDSALIEVESNLVEIESLISDRKAWLKTIPAEGMEVVIGDEIVRVYPPTKTSTSSYKITLSK
ncbi:hypothetical protein EBU24_05435 [bacterium]|nr:hypothetical protein [bacterium]